MNPKTQVPNTGTWVTRLFACQVGATEKNLTLCRESLGLVREEMA